MGEWLPFNLQSYKLVCKKDGKISYIVGALFGNESKDQCTMLTMNIYMDELFDIVDGPHMTKQW